MNRRFSGIANVYGEQGLLRLQTAHVAVIGIGGVGSWAVEALARSAIGAITMIDMDIVAESNVNRQILATSDSIGRDKVAVMKERIATINPQCSVTAIDDFLSHENLTQMLTADAGFVVDCIDDYRLKAALIAHCKRHKIPVVTVGAAGGLIDPSKIRQTDLSNTQHDSLLAKTRKLLRQDYHFARNPKRTFGIPCVYSDEQAVYPDGNGGVTGERLFEKYSDSTLRHESTGSLSCAGGIGSITHTTASFAFVAVAYVLKALSRI